MRFSIAASAALVAYAAASEADVTLTTTVCPESSAAAVPSPSVTTEVVTDFVTYCPEPTTIIHGTDTYTVTDATTLTITGEVTVTRPLITRTVTECFDCPSSVAPVPTSYPPVPVVPSSSIPVVPSVPTGPAPGVPTGVPTGPAPGVPTPSGPVPPSFDSGSSRAAVSIGALAGVFGIAAFLL